MLEVRALTVHYGKALALEDVSLDVPSNSLVAVIGPNGAGKTTLMRTISGLLRPTRGTVRFDSSSLVGLPAHNVVRKGIVQCPEGRRPFPELAVIENLQLGLPLWSSRAEAQGRLTEILGLFPRLNERGRQMAGTLSGGEQQMLAMARAIISKPKLLLLDEPSMGLSPIMVEKIFEVVRTISQEGITVLLVEQNARLALQAANRGYVMDSGLVTMEGEAKQMLDDPKVRAAYLGE